MWKLTKIILNIRVALNYSQVTSFEIVSTCTSNSNATCQVAKYSATTMSSCFQNCMESINGCSGFSFDETTFECRIATNSSLIVAKFNNKATTYVYGIN